MKNQVVKETKKTEGKLTIKEIALIGTISTIVHYVLGPSIETSTLNIFWQYVLEVTTTLIIVLGINIVMNITEEGDE